MPEQIVSHNFSLTKLHWHSYFEIAQKKWQFLVEIVKKKSVLTIFLKKLHPQSNFYFETPPKNLSKSDNETI